MEKLRGLEVPLRVTHWHPYWNCICHSVLITFSGHEVSWKCWTRPVRFKQIQQFLCFLLKLLCSMFSGTDTYSDGIPGNVLPPILKNPM